jgi:hypothetical protein
LEGWSTSLCLNSGRRPRRWRCLIGSSSAEDSATADATDHPFVGQSIVLEGPNEISWHGLSKPGGITSVNRHHFLSLLMLQIGSVTVGSALPNSDPSPTPSVVIGPDGTVHVTRVVPLPSTISAAARGSLFKMKPADQSHQTLQEHRTKTDKRQAERAQESLELYPAKLATDVIAGVPVRVVTPPEIAAEKAARVLSNLPGGGFRVDAGSLSETIPIANLTGTKVISVLYRLTSAGGYLTAEVAAELRKLNLPLPAALGIFAGGGDLSESGVFEALPHAFWYYPKLPESKEADQLMAAFFDRHVGK